MESPLLHLIYHLVSISTSKHGEVCYSARLVVGQAVTYPKYMDVYIFDLARTGKKQLLGQPWCCLVYIHFISNKNLLIKKQQPYVHDDEHEVSKTITIKSK